MATSSNPPSADNRTLPKKEHDLFRSLIKSYEEKQYKKGIKNADLILKKFPNHGETQAMKGLILSNMGKKEESYELVKLGLKNDVRSHVCWHVFGLLYRSDRNYKEAIKCYLNALRIDKENQNILRDLSFLQVQMRDMSGFSETRRKLLTLKPTNKIHWISYAVSLYCSGNYQTANEVVDKFLSTSMEERIPYEQSELYLFQNRCLESSGRLHDALQHLETSKSLIVDQLSWKIKKGELLIKTGQYSEALELWHHLLVEQPDNYRFHTGYQISLLQLSSSLASEMLTLQKLEVPASVLQLSDEQISILREAYQTKAPKSTASTRILLSLHPLTTHETEFKELLSQYIKKGLRSGVPNIYNDICALIRVPDHLQPQPQQQLQPQQSRRLVYAKDIKDYQSHPITLIVLEILENFIQSLTTNGTFDLTPLDDAITEVPTTLLWCYYLYSHMLSVCGRNEDALRYIELSIDHTPTSLDSIAKRARILKNCGDYYGASEQMNYCRSLDLQDRYVNNKATKYYLRADRIEEGMSTIAMFTKHDGDPQQTLYDLQCIWYELEIGESYSRKGQYGLALKKFYAVEKHFTDFVEDQFDFHAFSIRKTTLRAYLDVIETTNTIFSHKFFQRAGQNVLEIMLKRFHLMNKQNQTIATDETQATLTAAERKREKNKQKKLAKKEENAAAETTSATTGTGTTTSASTGDEKKSNKKGQQTPVDEDPKGMKILEKDILEECSRWCHLLTKGGSCKDLKTLALVCEVMLLKEKYLLALRCLTSGLSQDPSHPLLNYQLINFTTQFYVKVGIISSSSDPSSASASSSSSAGPSTTTTPHMFSFVKESKPLNPVVEQVIHEKLQSLLGGVGPDILFQFIENYLNNVERNVTTLEHRLMATKMILTFQHGTIGEDQSQRTQRAISFLLDDKLWQQRGINFKNILNVFKIVESDLKIVELMNSFKQKIQEHYPRSNLFNTTGSPIYKGVHDLEFNEI